MDSVAKLDQIRAAARQMAEVARALTEAFEDAGFTRDEALDFAHHILGAM